MPLRDRFTVRVLGVAIRIYALIVLPVTYTAVGNHPILAWYFVPLILFSRFRFTLLAFAYVLALSAAELWLGSTPAPTIGLGILTACVVFSAWKKSLLEPVSPNSAAGKARKRMMDATRPVLLLIAGTTAIVAVCARNAPLMDSFLWAVCMASIARSIPRQKRQVSRATAVATVLMATVSWLAAAACIEIGARFIFPATIRPSDMYMEDNRYIFKLRPNSVDDFVLRDNDEKKITIRANISSQGVRNRELFAKKPREFRIVAIGDSYTMGHGIPEPQTYPRVLEKMLEPPPGYDSVTVVNCGVGGYAPWQERGLLNAVGFRFEPDLVILQVFPSNDVAGTLSRVGKYLRAIDIEWERRLSYLRRQNEPAVRTERWLERNVYTYDALALLLSEPHLATNFLHECRFWPAFAIPRVPAGEDRHAYREASFIEMYPELTEGYTLMEDDIRGIQSDCARRNVGLIAFAHPYPMDAIDDGWREQNRKSIGVTFELDKDVRLTNAIFDRAHIPRAPITEALESVPDQRALYFRHDGHWTPEAARIVAQTLRDFLSRDYFPAHASQPEK